VYTDGLFVLSERALVLWKTEVDCGDVVISEEVIADSNAQRQSNTSGDSLRCYRFASPLEKIASDSPRLGLRRWVRGTPGTALG
jgi:hypothetical protein